MSFSNKSLFIVGILITSLIIILSFLIGVRKSDAPFSLPGQALNQRKYSTFSESTVLNYCEHVFRDVVDPLVNSSLLKNEKEELSGVVCIIDAGKTQVEIEVDTVNLCNALHGRQDLNTDLTAMRCTQDYYSYR